MSTDVDCSRKRVRWDVVRKAISIWFIIILAEIVHGIARRLFLVPVVGELRSNQLGVVSGSFIVLVIAVIFVSWLDASRPIGLLLVGMLWAFLTLVFEFLFGHFVMRLAWARLFENYNILAGGLMPFGLIFLGVSPWIAAKLRGKF